MSVGEYMSSLVHQIKQYWSSLKIKEWTEEFLGATPDIMETGIAFGVTFAVGFFFKRYFKILFITLLFFFLALKVLEYNNFLTIHWSSIQAALGLSDKIGMSQLTELFINWVKKNGMLFIAGLVGFFIGYKLG